MANQISGRVIAVAKEKTVASSDASKKPLRKREIYIDCTRYDPYTGERSQFENQPLLEFSGDKVLEKVNPKLDGIVKGDVVTISFDIQGTPYKDQQGKMKVYTAIRCFDIEVRRKADGTQVVQQQAQPAQVQAPVQHQAVEQPPVAQSSFIGEEKKDDLPF
jgi:hypothetical protein